MMPNDTPHRQHYIVVSKIAVVSAAIPVLLYAFSGGPEPGHTGAPGETTCAVAGCHAGGTPSPNGSVRIALAANTYTPGQRQRVTVTVSDPNQTRWGFQLTARSGGDFRTQAGTFTPTDGLTQEICSSAAFIDQNCTASSTYRYAEHTAAGTRRGTNNSVNFEFDWTPPATSVGTIRLFAAGNAANGDSSSNGDRIYTTTLEVTPAAAGNRPAISSGGVQNGASFQPGIAPNSWITIKGSNFGTATRENRADEIVNNHRPTSMDGISVTVNSKPAFFYFISPGQLNVVSPDDDAVGNVPVAVTVSGQSSEVAQVQLQKYSPAFFLWPGNQAVATSADFQFRVRNGTFPGATTTAAKPGEVIVLWGTGFGPTTPAIPAGQVVTGAPTVNSAIRVTVGGAQAEYFGAALAPGFTALYQVAIRIPESAPNGDLPVVATIEGVSSPSSAVIAVQR
ncbi:MAG: choice-of-anchor V domain-containing protein [Bryobacteraceae bacterium]